MRTLKQRKYALVCKDATRTEQAHKEDCDINTIMARAKKGQSSPYIREHDGYYGEATATNFYEANVIVANANSMFEELPAKVRNRFDNDPGQFLDFIHNPANSAEAQELGLIKRPPEVVTEDSPPPSSLSENPPKGDVSPKGEETQPSQADS